jgi:MoaA/NifB/PqqE/SkfB family radical SAM enzyme
MPAKVPPELCRYLQAQKPSPAGDGSFPNGNASVESPTVFCANTTDFSTNAILAHIRQTHECTERTFPTKLYHLEICPTAVCQIACTFCSYETRNLAGNRLPLQILKQVLEDARYLQVVGCYWSGGGDPLAAKAIDSLVGESSEFCGVSMQTNAVSLDRLLKHGCSWFNQTCDLITWSIYAHQEELFNKACRAEPSKFRKIVENITTAVRFRDQWHLEHLNLLESLPPVHISGKIVVNRENFRALPEMLEFARDLKLDTYHIRLVDNYEPGQDVALTPEQIDELKRLVRFANDPVLKSFGASLERRHEAPTACPCYSIREGINAIVETNGDVFLSIPSDGHRFSIGNVNQTRLRDLWGSPQHLEIIHRLENEFSAPVSKDRHHKIDLAIHEFETGERHLQLTPEMLTTRNFRQHQRAQL